MKTAIVMLALAGLLLAGPMTASATALDQPQQASDEKIACSPLVEPVCFTYYYYCRNYLRFCPIA